MFRTALIAILFAAAPAFAQEVVLKKAPGVDDVTMVCGICHTLNYIRMNSPFLTPDGWKGEVTKMQQAFGAPFDDATASEIVKYLSANYAAPAKP